MLGAGALTVVGIATVLLVPPFLVASTPSMKALSASSDIIAMFNSPFFVCCD